MPTLHLLHGFIGSGKTTFAGQLERDRGAVRFSPDEWMVTLHGTNPPEALFRQQEVRINELLWQQALRVWRAGVDVILEGGFWTRASRDDARRRAADAGAAYRFYALRCSLAEARQRTLQRTACLPPGTLEITGETFDLLARQFEPMGADEEHIVVGSQADGEAGSGGQAGHPAG